MFYRSSDVANQNFNWDFHGTWQVESKIDIKRSWDNQDPCKEKNKEGTLAIMSLKNYYKSLVIKAVCHCQIQW